MDRVVCHAAFGFVYVKQCEVVAKVCVIYDRGASFIVNVPLKLGFAGYFTKVAGLFLRTLF